MAELRECPRCQSAMRVESDNEPTPFYSVACTGCDLVYHASGLTEEDAADAWNAGFIATRAPGSAMAGLGCADCGAPYDDPAWIEAVVPDAIWNEQLSPQGNEGGILCILCMARRAVAKGLSDVPVLLTAGPFALSAPTANGAMAELREALEPFAKLADWPFQRLEETDNVHTKAVRPSPDGGKDLGATAGLTIGDFYRAKSALAHPASAAEGWVAALLECQRLAGEGFAFTGDDGGTAAETFVAIHRTAASSLSLGHGGNDEAPRLSRSPE